MYYYHHQGECDATREGGMHKRPDQAQGNDRRDVDKKDTPVVKFSQVSLNILVESTSLERRWLECPVYKTLWHFFHVSSLHMRRAFVYKFLHTRFEHFRRYQAGTVHTLYRAFYNRCVLSLDGNVTLAEKIQRQMLLRTICECCPEMVPSDQTLTRTTSCVEPVPVDASNRSRYMVSLYDVYCECVSKYLLPQSTRLERGRGGPVTPIRTMDRIEIALFSTLFGSEPCPASDRNRRKLSCGPDHAFETHATVQSIVTSPVMVVDYTRLHFEAANAWSRVVSALGVADSGVGTFSADASEVDDGDQWWLHTACGAE